MTTLNSSNNRQLARFLEWGLAHYLGLFAVTILSLGLRFFMLGHQSLWIDEGFSLYYSEGESLKVVLDRLLVLNASDRLRVLFYLFLHLWRELFGESERTLRSLPVLFGFAATLLTYVAARSSFSKSRSLWSFFLISISAYCVFYSQELRDYSMLMAIAAAQLLCLSVALSPSKRLSPEPIAKRSRSSMWARWSFALLTIVGLFANILAVYYTAALAVAHLITTPRFKIWLGWWLPTVGLSVLPGYFYISSPAFSEPDTIATGRLQGSILQHFGYSVYGFLSGLTYGPPQAQLRGEDRLQSFIEYWPFLLLLLIVGLGLGLMLFALIVGRWNTSAPSRFDRLLFYTLLFTLLFGLGFVYLTKMDWLPRHLCYLWPAFALILPALSASNVENSNLVEKNAGITQQKIASQRSAWKTRTAQFCLSLFVAINAIALCNYYFSEQHYRDDFRAVADYVLQHKQPDQVSVLIGGAGNTILLEYYGDFETLDGKKIKLSAEQSLAQQLETLTDSADEVLLLSNRVFYLYGTPAALVKELSMGYQVEQVEEFQYFHIYQLQKLPASKDTPEVFL